MMENTYNKFVESKVQVTSDEKSWLDWFTPETLILLLNMGLNAIQNSGMKERNKINLKFSLA